MKKEYGIGDLDVGERRIVEIEDRVYLELPVTWLYNKRLKLGDVVHMRINPAFELVLTANPKVKTKDIIEASKRGGKYEK